MQSTIFIIAVLENFHLEGSTLLIYGGAWISSDEVYK